MRLKTIKLFSIQRRFERYRIMYTWKILKGLVPNCNLSWSSSLKGATLISEPPYKEFDKLQRQNSFHYNASRLYNSLPRILRDNIDVSKDVWKSLLDDHLSLIPDHPAIDGLIPEPCDCLNSNPCNSILSWS